MTGREVFCKLMHMGSESFRFWLVASDFTVINDDGVYECTTSAEEIVKAYQI